MKLMMLPPRPPVVSDPAAPHHFSGVRLGRRAFIAGTAGLVAGATLWSGSAAAAEPGASYFEAVDPRRLCDTRARAGLPAGFGYERLDDRIIRVRITGAAGIPADAVAAVLTVTGVGGGVVNYLSAFPAGEGWPGTSTVNMAPTDTAVANLATVKLGGGAVDVLAYAPCDVIVDIVGVYRPTSSAVTAGRLVAFPAAVRALDTRSGAKPGAGAVVNVNLNGLVPSGAIAVVATLTAVDSAGIGYVTAYPRGTRLPDTSNLNLGPGQTRAVGVITKLGSSGGITGVDLYTYNGAHLLFDVVGYMTGSSDASSTDGLFVPITPTRMLDTRTDKLRLWNGWTRQFELPAPISTRAQAIAMNLTVTGTVGNSGYYTLFAAQTPRREVSNLNVTGSGQTIANHAISRISDRGVACYSYEVGHVICDVTGWYTGSPARATTGPPVNPPPPGGPIPWLLQVPRLGLNQWVVDGDAKRTVDSGRSWHWTGTGLVGQGGNSVMFGHRTEHGGPYRYQHLLRDGDLAYVYTSDGRRYTYSKGAESITSKYSPDILAATRRLGGETISMVSCSRPNRLPTSLEHRLVTTFRFVGWEDLG